MSNEQTHLLLLLFFILCKQKKFHSYFTCLPFLIVWKRKFSALCLLTLKEGTVPHGVNVSHLLEQIKGLALAVNYFLSQSFHSSARRSVIRQMTAYAEI
jgi:hypothetical protein